MEARKSASLALELNARSVHGPASLMPRRLIRAPGVCTVHPWCRQDGFTLVEAAVTLVLLTMVVGGSMTILFQSQLTFADQMQQSTLWQTSHRIHTRLVNELFSADLSSVTPALLDDSLTISFQRVEGYAAGVPLYGLTVTIDFELAPGEIANGSDDNLDGRVDEGVVRYTEGANPPVVIASDVLGLRFNSTVNGVSYACDIGFVDREGLLHTDTVSGRVTLRN